MFAVIVFIPEYQQIVRGYSATASGLLMLPLVAGMLVASISSGRIISHTGKYRTWPIGGTLVMALGFFLLSLVTRTTPEWLFGVAMFITGLGIGSFMQVMTLAVQNSTDVRNLGTATAAVVFFRSLGGTFGTALFGAILANRLTVHVTELVPRGAGVPAISSESLNAGASFIASLPPQIADMLLNAFSLAFHDLFIWALPFALFAFVIALFLKEIPLRHEVAERAEGEAFGI